MYLRSLQIGGGR